MDISLILKIAGIGLIVTVFYQILKSLNRDEQATYVSIAGIVVVLFLLITEIAKLYQEIQSVFRI